MQKLEMRNITKTFPGVRALDGVTFDLYEGEFHALVGENGAGKSTLMKVLGGVYPYPQYGGEIRLDGQERRFGSVRDAETAGIAVIYQELSLIQEMSIAENIFLGREPRRFGVIDWEAIYSRAQQLLAELHLKIDPRTPVDHLGIGQQQLVEIAKALSHDARILVLDEPTAALTDAEVETLFGMLNNLRARGVGMIYISHKLKEVFRMSDRITVLRDGRTVDTQRASELDEARVIARMVGREVGDIFPQASHEHGDFVFEARNITVTDPNVQGKLLVKNVSFAVRRGEVLGIAGLLGSGRDELPYALAGAAQTTNDGGWFIEGQPVPPPTAATATELGISFVPAERAREGLIAEFTVRENLTLGALPSLRRGRFIQSRSELRTARTWLAELGIPEEVADRPVSTLSGGNQQRVLFGRCLHTEPKVLVLAEPTAGVDVGAREALYELLRARARQGLSIVLASSDTEDLLSMCDRVLVLRRGIVAEELIGTAIDAERIVSVMESVR